jgi:very-short-patch-repair endonuclease
LWAALRSRQVEGLKFRRQVPIGPFIADFYCHAARLVVEVDGDVHAGREAADRERSDWLKSQGLRVIRFTNREVLDHLDEVAAEIVRVCGEKLPSP